MTRYANPFGAFEIDSLPGQSQVAVCHSFVVPEDKRGRGYAHALKSFQEIELDINHYDLAICTVSANNAAQKRVLSAAGWRYLTHFRNCRSSETTELWCRGGHMETPTCAESSKTSCSPSPSSFPEKSPAAASALTDSANNPSPTGVLIGIDPAAPGGDMTAYFKPTRSQA